MILELLGLGILGAIGKSVYDEAKKSDNKSQSSDYVPINQYSNNQSNTAPENFCSSDLTGIINNLELNSNVGSIIDDNGLVYNIIFSKNSFKYFPNNTPKVNDKVIFTSQAVNDRLYANNIRYKEITPKTSNNTQNFSKRTNETSNTNTKQKSTEELIMQKINSLPRTFDYSSTTLNSNALFGGCVTMLADILDSVVSSNNLNQLKLTLSAKKQRYNSTTEYNECLENNIVFELYKYDNFIKIFNIFDSDMNSLNKMNYQTFCMIMLNDSKKNVSSAKQLAQNNSFIRNLLVNYSYKDTENREFDYIFSSLKVSVIALAMQSVLYGYIEISDKRISGKEFFKHFSSKNNIAALDTVIIQGIANRLSKLY